ncbi:MAG: nucleotidyltransferase family protein [Candidatus Omnitrophota bacterium]
MDLPKKIILELLNGKINPDTLANVKDEDWSYLVGLAKKKGIATVIFYNLKKANLLLSVPDLIRKDLENNYYCVLTQNTLALRELAKILKALDKLGIRSIILKGTALINSVYGDNPGLRPMIDIDILILPGQLDITEKCLEGLGYKISTRDFGSIIYSRNGDDSLTLSAKLLIEIHWQVLHNKFNRVLNIDEIMFYRRAVNFKIEGLDCLGLSVEDNILYLSLHLTMIHFFENIIWLYDIKRILEVYKESISWDKLLKTANESGTKNMIYYCLSYCKDILGAPIEGEIIQKFSPSKLKKKVISRILKKDYIWQEEDLGKVSYLVQFLMFDTTGSLIKLLISNIFPDKGLLRYRYPAKSYLKAYISYILRPFKIFLNLSRNGKTVS